MATQAVKSPPVFMLAAHWFGMGFTWSLLATNLLPRDVAGMVGETEKGFRLGLIYSAAAVISVFVPPIIGAYSDARGDRHRILALGAGVVVFGLMVMLLARSVSGYWGYFCGAMLVEFGSSTVHGAYAAVVPELVPRAQQGRASAAITLLRLTGTIIGVLAGASVLDRTLKFMLASSLVIVTVIVTLKALLTLKALGQSKAIHSATLEPASNSIGTYSMGTYFSPAYRDFRLVFGSRFLVELGKDALQPFLLYYLIDSVRRFELGPLRLERPETAQAVLLLCIVGMATISALIAGQLVDRFGRVKIAVAGGLIQACAAIGFAISRDYATTLACGLVFGLGQGAFLVADWALVSVVLPSRSNFGRDMAVWHVSMVATGLFGGLFGRLLDGTNRTSPGSGYSLLFVLSAVSLALGAALTARVRFR
jgi:MFS family permease